MQFRKPSSTTYSTSILSSRQALESRFLSKRGVVYGCTTLILLLLFSFIINDGTSKWVPKPLKEPFESLPTPSGVITDIIPLLTPPKEDSQPPPQPLAPSTTDQNERLSKDGLPLISTRNEGRVVLLTGATGPG